MPVRVDPEKPGKTRAPGPSAGDDAPREGSVEQRRAARHPVAGVRCGLAVVTDLSDTGMRLHAPWPWAVGRARWTRLRHARKSARVRARCVWKRREGFRWVLGVAFDDPNAWRVKQAVELALRGRMDRP